MKVLITGAGGQLATAMQQHAEVAGHEVVAATEHELDITDLAACERWVARHAGGAVINAAAYTAVDRAESEPDQAHAVNADGAKHLAIACARHGARLFHVSTDYVFDGVKPGGYGETDAVNPLGVYGKTKAAGEAAVQAALPTAVIVRTSWVFSATGTNFVKTILRLAQQRPSLRVVADQHGCPTHADELARALCVLLARDVSGIFHFCGDGATTWHGFATAIVEGARARAPIMATHVEAITTAEYPTPTKRPVNSVLDTTKIRALGITPRPWREGLGAVLDALLP